MKHVGRPLPNAALLGAFAAATGLISLESVGKAIREKFPAKVAEANILAAATPSSTCATRAGGRNMLKQIEGSKAVAEAVALCRPEVICAYPISPQTHIVEGLGEMVKSGTLAPCEFINVESEFAAMSVAIGASAAGARAYTATASQGLLFMAEAVYNAAGLGLPIVMTVANRAIGAPINIWNDHTDTMSQRDCGWIQLFAETNQEALDLHIQAFRLAEELSHAGDGVHGRLHPDARLRARGHAHAGAGRRVPARLRAAPGARLERARVDRRHGRARGLHGGALPGACQADAGAGPHPADRRRVRAALRPRLRRARARLPPRRRRDGGGGAGLGAGHAARTPSTNCAARASASACWASPRSGPFPMAAIRAALQGAKRVVVLEKSFCVGLGGIVSADVRLALSGLQLQGYTVVAGLGGRAITQASLHACCWKRRPASCRLSFLDLDWRIVNRELDREAPDAAQRADRRGPAARRRRCRIQSELT